VRSASCGLPRPRPTQGEHRTPDAHREEEREVKEKLDVYQQLKQLNILARSTGWNGPSHHRIRISASCSTALPVDRQKLLSRRRQAAM